MTSIKISKKTERLVGYQTTNFFSSFFVASKHFLLHFFKLNLFFRTNLIFKFFYHHLIIPAHLIYFLLAINSFLKLNLCH